jgi:cystathionine beta-lyase/cystathionine gamma-synthase
MGMGMGGTVSDRNGSPSLYYNSTSLIARLMTVNSNAICVCLSVSLQGSVSRVYSSSNNKPDNFEFTD